MVSRKCPICGCYIEINGKDISITKEPTAMFSVVLCQACKKWINENTQGGE